MEIRFSGNCVNNFNDKQAYFEISSADSGDFMKNNYKTYGVWILFGRKGNEWECLQVGESGNIYDEILADIEALRGNIRVEEEKAYINQFGQYTGYTYTLYPSAREQIYNQIGKIYEVFWFVCLCHGENYKEQLKNIEKYAAWKFRAKFWRNGGAFKKQRSDIVEPPEIKKFQMEEKQLMKEINAMINAYQKQGEKVREI